MNKWKWFIIEGILLFVIGIFAIARPGVASEALVEFFGWLLLVLGLLSIFGVIANQTGPRTTSAMAGGAIAGVVGLIFLLMPVPTLALLTIFVAIFFLLTGVMELTSSCLLRSIGGHDNHWGLAFFNGLITLLLGIFLIVLWPDSFEVIGLLIGLNFLLSGTYLFSLGWFIRHAPAH